MTTNIVGLIVLVIIIIVVVIVVVKFLSRQSCHSTIEAEKRFSVGRHHRRKHSSSSSDNTFIPGGIGAICLVSADCSTGLACENQTCVCPRPGTPAVTTTLQGTNSIIVTWTPVTGADFYQVVLYKVSSPTVFVPVEFATVEGITSLIYFDVPPGNYRAEVKAGSNACGLGFDTTPGTSTITIGTTCTTDQECTIDESCQNGFCTPLANQGLAQRCLTSTNCASGLVCTDSECVCPATPQVQPEIALGPHTGSVTVSWPATPGVDVFRVELRKQCTPVPPATDCFSEIVGEATVANSPDVTSIEFGDLVPGAVYFADLFTGSSACGVLATAQPSTSATVKLPCQTYVFPSEVRVVQGFLSDHNTRVVSLEWDPPTPTPDYYLFRIENNTGPAAVIQSLDLVTPAVIVTLTAGFTYNVQIFPYSATCPVDVNDVLLASFFVSPVPP